MNFRSAVVVSLAAAAVSGQQPAERWWSHVTFLANDSMKGRDTGSPEHRKAAEYIADHFKRAGLYLGVVAEVANRPTRPQWNQDSFFKRFAQ